MKSITIFGREPAALVGVVEAALALALSFGLFGLTEAHVVNIVAVVVAALGVYTAYVTRDTMLGVVVGAVKALLALAIGYGAPLTMEETGALIAFVTVAVGLFQRTQTAPAVTPSFRDPTPAAEVGDASPGTPIDR